MKKLLTFLGNAEYEEGIYTDGKRKATASRFVQTAIYELYCKDDFSSEDQIIIFLTKEAEAKNWKNSIGTSFKNKGKELEGLENTWKRIDRGLLERDQIKRVRIPSKQDEKHNWILFETILKEIDPGDEIIFDITYGFRSFPVLALLILNYTRILKNANLKNLLYGCREMKDDNNPPNVPIIDMTKMIPLLDWANGIDSYLKTGNASVIQSLKSGVTDEETEELIKLANSSQEFHQIMQICQAPEIPKGLDPLRSALEQAKNMKIPGSNHFKELIDKMDEKIKDFTGRPIMDDYLAAKWCFDNGLIQQGYTMLQEGIISALCRVREKDLSNHNTRKKARNWIKNPPKELHKLIPNITDYKKPFDELTKFRDNMNHAGWNICKISHEDFYTKSEQFLQIFLPFFEELDKLYQNRQEGVAKG